MAKAHGLHLALAATLLAAAVSPAAWAQSAQVPAAQVQPAPLAPMADRLNLWSPSEQAFGYRRMEAIYPTTVIRAGGKVRELPVATAELAVEFRHDARPYDVAEFMTTNRVSGLLVIRDGRIVLERYGLGRKPTDRWTSFSIAKSVTSTLIGAALRDKRIASLDDPLSRYVPELKGGAYDPVTIRQALAMRSGVGWKEDYNDPASDFSRYATQMGPDFYRRMSAQPRVAEPGGKFYYSTAESNLLGAVVINATGKSLSQYFSEKIWQPFGMEADGVWMASREGLETGGICFSATLRDYGRLGLFWLEGARAGGKAVVPDGWMAEATAPRSDKAFGELGYGYQWWTGPDGAYRGIGIMGQALFVDPKRKLVVVVQSAWTRPGGPQYYDLQWAFIAAVKAAADRAPAPAGASER